jgi:hypothetical protein
MNLVAMLVDLRGFGLTKGRAFYQKKAPKECLASGSLLASPL